MSLAEPSQNLHTPDRFASPLRSPSEVVDRFDFAITRLRDSSLVLGMLLIAEGRPDAAIEIWGSSATVARSMRAQHKEVAESLQELRRLLVRWKLDDEGERQALFRGTMVAEKLLDQLAPFVFGGEGKR